MAKLIQCGPTDARIALIGEAPGATEDSTGIPFSGGSGHVLDKMLSRAGLRRDECWISNVCHVRPDKNDFAWFLKPANQVHLLQGILQLKKDLTAIQPNVVVALGSQPLRILTGKQGIDKWRGSILPCTLVPGLKVIGTYHPAYILRVYDYKAVAEFDLSRVAKEQLYSGIDYPQRAIYTPTGVHHRPGTDWQFTSAAVDIWPIVNSMLAAEWLAVDIECWQDGSGGWKLSCVGFSDRPGRALVIPYDTEQHKHAIRLLCTSGIPKVLQNGTFDSTVLRQAGIHLTNFAWDTMLAHHALFAECAGGQDELSNQAGKRRQSAIAKGLAFQASLYTREPFYKDDGKLWRETSDVQVFYRYNGLDACVTREIRDVQYTELQTFPAWDTFNHEMSLVQPLMDATDRGIKVDLAERKRLREVTESRINELQGVLDGTVGVSVNVKSSKQVQELLYGKLNLPTRTVRGTGRPTANKDAIVALAARHKHPALHAILRIREQRDLLERYIAAPIDPDGRMRCSFDITGTRSGRLSSRISIYGSGTNLQTIPGDLRHLFIADEGKVFIYRDYSQAEARVVAYLARCRGLIDLFNDPTRDVHKENAARIFNKRVEEVSPEERYLAKRIVHACNYGMAEKRFAEVINEDAHITGVTVTDYEARMLVEKFFAIYPEIREIFWREVENELRKTRTLTTPFGRKRVFYGRWDDKLLREAYSYIPQSTVGDLCCMAIPRLRKFAPEAEFLLAVHDSILVQCDEMAAHRVAEQMGQAMDIPFVLQGTSITIPTDVKVGRNWGERGKDGSNPEGLVKWEH